MRFFLFFLLASTVLARAQAPIVATPLAPLNAATPLAPLNAATPLAQLNAATPPVLVPVPVPAPTAAAWVPKQTALVQALDKVNARSKLLTIKVGQSATFGTLTIAVMACHVRPPDAPADATAFLTIADKNPQAPGFSGWMLKATPSVSMLAHPIYDVRVVGCS